MPRRLATIDVGTNSVLLLAAEAGDDGRLRPLADRMEITRLGRGVDRTGVLSEEALAETLAAIRAFAEEARALGCGEIFATATSAARDAANGRELVDRAAVLGVPVEIISGEREAQLSWHAVTSDFLEPGRTLAAIDIGGGSTEFIVGDGPEVGFRHSFDVGSVRMTERFVEGDPPSAASLGRVEAHLAATFATVPKLPAGGRAIGIAGTFTTLAAVSLGLEPYDAGRVHGLELPVAELERVGRHLAALPLADRRRVPGLSPKRADVIVAGALVAAASVRALGVDRVTIGDRGVRWGLAYERLGR
jgi:exopolyphosphatase / guanosine-5'-triphosphate,3'-diphosphate pyrophosphatase